MDPFTIGAAIISLGSMLSGYFRRQAKAELGEATSRLQNAQRRAKSSYRAAICAINSLGTRRLGSLCWLPQRLMREMEAVGDSTRLAFNTKDIFGKRTLQEIRKIIDSAKRLVLSSRDSFDKAVVLSSGAALVVEGVQYLDDLGTIDVPLLHTDLADAVSTIDIDHLGFADMLGGLGDLPILEVLQDGLVVFSAFRLVNNIRRYSSTQDDISGANSQASHFDGIAERMNATSVNVGQLRAAHEESAYQVFKWSTIAAMADASPGYLSDFERRKVRDLMLQSGKAWWSGMQLQIPLPR